MAVAYREAEDEVVEMAAAIIKKFHPHLEHATIRYIFRSVHAEDAGRTVFATATACRGRLQFFAECDFIIEIAEDCWETFNDGQKRALLDHELSHCAVGKKGWEIVGHDIEEFGSIIERYGGWTDCRAAFMDAVEKRRWMEAHGQTEES